jgi:starch-binding outer membrane protein, SusD/RagB family
MKKLNIALLIVFVSVIAIGCKKDFLDTEINNKYSENEAFSNYSKMSQGANAVYNELFDRFGFNRINGAMLASACDEADHAAPLSTISLFNTGTWNATSNPENYWGFFYESIRKANLFLEGTADYKNILYRDTLAPNNKSAYYDQVRDIAWFRAEARFIRAFIYFELIKRYGGVPIMDRVINDEETLRNIQRQSFDSCAAYIINECDSIVPLLNNTWVGVFDDKWRGRATKGAAMALKARVLLYAASPLNNPGNNTAKWQKAALAAHDIITSNKYSLHNDYGGLFQLGNGADVNPEVLFAIQGWSSNVYEKANIPVGYDQGGVNSTCPSQNLVDAYEMKTTGRPIGEPGSSFNPANPYANRDPRLTASIIVNNTVFKGRPVECWVGGLDGLGKPKATTTGYYLRKYLDESLDIVQNKGRVHSWILFRYAEVLLNYAEAMNEAYGPESRGSGYTFTAKQAVDLVRLRAGMPKLDPGLSQTEMRQRIRNERRVELAFEEHRFFDVRRWKIAEQTENTPIMAMKIIKKDDGSFTYTIVKAEDRAFDKSKMYLYPIPQAEVLKSNGAITQNDNW